MLLAVYRNCLIAPKGKLTVKDYLIEWLDGLAVVQLDTVTQEGYRRIVENHLLPALGSTLLSKLTPSQVEAYYTRAIRQGLSSYTVLHHHRVLHRALKHAVLKELVGRNVTEFLTTTPKRGDFRSDVYNEQELAAMLDVSAGTRDYVPILLAVYAGLRREEVCGARWRDSDLGNYPEIRVIQVLKSTGEGLKFGPPKPRASRRTIPLPPSIIPELKRHRAEQTKERLALGKAYQNNDLVVYREDGSPVTPGTLSHHFSDMLKRAGLPHIRFHDLRHGYATLMLERGVDMKTVSERMGHSSIQITMDLYGHVTPRMRTKATDVMDNIFLAVQRIRDGKADGEDENDAPAISKK